MIKYTYRYIYTFVQLNMATFYDNIVDYFEKDITINYIIAKPNIDNFQSKIIKDYTNIIEGSGEYFEDRVMCSFNEYFNRCENEDLYVIYEFIKRYFNVKPLYYYNKNDTKCIPFKSSFPFLNTDGL